MCSDKRREFVAIAAVARPVIESLEGRALFSLTYPVAPNLLTALMAEQASRTTAASATVSEPIFSAAAMASPSVTGSRPASGATNVLRDTVIAADVKLPNVGHGVDAATLTAATVKLYETSTGAQVEAIVNTTGGGDAIILQPTALLTANTNYTFEITSGVKDTSGAAFTPYKIKFTTGASSSVTSTSVSFSKTPQAASIGQQWTSVTFGPDGRLYASTLKGKIFRFALDGAGNLGAGELINAVRDNNGGDRLITGIVFDPQSTASNMLLWVSHGQSVLDGATDWTGKLSALSGPNLGTCRDVVVGLPRSIRDHLTNQATFGPDGALYLSQASMSAMGGADDAWGNRSEHLLNASILRIDTKAITGTLNVKTESGGTYNPFAASAPLTIYAEGVRNAFDLVWHRNGHLYAPTNGSAAGGSTPGGGGAPALSDVDETQPDFLFDIKPGGYYGHPNPKQGHFVLNGGNPTSSMDVNEVTSYPVGTKPDANYRGAAYNFGDNFSADGIIEYKGSAFNGTLDGKLLVVRYSGGDDILILTPDENGNIVKTEKGAPGLTGFNDPLDLIENPATGFIYVAEHGGQQITLLKPNPTFSFDKGQLVYSDIKGGGASASQTITFRNDSGKTITIPSDGISLTGASADQFEITAKPSGAKTLAAGASFSVSVRFAASSSTSFGIKTAGLAIRTTQGTPALEIALRGLALDGSGGSSEPSLQKILDLFNIGTRVGDANVEDSQLQNPPTTPNDEVAAQQFFKAGGGDVTIEPLAGFSPVSSPTYRLGWYQSGNAATGKELFTVASAFAQSVTPIATGATSFDPGSSAFSLYTKWPSQNNRVVFGEDALNAWEPTASLRHKVRVYQLKTAEGVVVPNAYVVGFEEIPGNVSDHQDGVFIIRNVALAPVAVQAPTVSMLKLVDADNGVTLRSLNNGGAIYLGETPRISVQALVAGTIGSVRFQLDGKTFSIENAAPYLINGDNNGAPKAWTPTVGTHTLRVTAYGGAGASGTIGNTRVITFTVYEGSTPGGLFKEFINFQPANAPTVAGYRVDSGQFYGLRSNGLTYGWSQDNTALAVDRNAPNSIDQRFDTLNELGDMDWAIRVPNGTYSVYVAAGDPVTINAFYGIMVEGKRAVWGAPTQAEPWVGGTVTVQVTDGTITLRRAVGSRNNKLNFIQIAQLS